MLLSEFVKIKVNSSSIKNYNIKSNSEFYDIPVSELKPTS